MTAALKKWQWRDDCNHIVFVFHANGHEGVGIIKKDVIWSVVGDDETPSEFFEKRKERILDVATTKLLTAPSKEIEIGFGDIET